MAIENVDLPIKHGGSFHSFLYVYQRVQMVEFGAHSGDMDGPRNGQMSLS